MLLAFLLLVVGMLLLIKGADWFVEGASKIAKAMKIPTLIIGLTLVSMGTSAPELSVSINAAIAGSSDLSFGNVVGSNIFNTFFILGVASLFVPLAFDEAMRKYDVPIMVGIYAVLTIFSFLITPYNLDTVESIILCILFVSYLALLFVRAKKQQNEETLEEKEEEKPVTKKQIILNILMIVVGLAAIIFGGDLVVDNAVIIAD